MMEARKGAVTSKTNNFSVNSILIGVVIMVVASAAYYMNKIFAASPSNDNNNDVEMPTSSITENKASNLNDNSNYDQPQTPKPVSKVGNMVERLEERAVKESPNILSMMQRQASFDPRRAASPKRF